MALTVGIVGLPNSGKSTLFNALSSRRLAETAARPFTTIDPHEAVVPVPDGDLEELSNLIDPEETSPATVTFIDIAGLIKDAHKGEGLGNQFLSKIKEVDAIIHVVRAFSDPNIAHSHASHEPGSKNQILEDIEIINLELQLASIEDKPMIYVLNVDEGVTEHELTKELSEPSVVISAKLEEELIDLDKEDKEVYLEEVGIKSTGLEKLIKKSYAILDLITFYTIKGGKEVHGWSIREGSSALDAAGTVHTDFAENFIKAEVVNVRELLTAGGWKEAKEEGKVRLEGRDYIVKHKDVIEFKVGS